MIIYFEYKDINFMRIKGSGSAWVAGQTHLELSNFIQSFTRKAFGLILL